MTTITKTDQNKMERYNNGKEVLFYEHNNPYTVPDRLLHLISNPSTKEVERLKKISNK